MKRVCLVIVALFALGCGGIKKDDLVGTWTGTVEMSDLALEAAVAQAKRTNPDAQVTKEMIANMMSGSQSTLTLNADDTFSMNLGPVSYSGTWSFDSMVISMKLEKMLGMSIEDAATQFNIPEASMAQMREPFKLNLSEDGKTASGTSPGDAGTTLNFSRPDTQ